MIQGTTSDAGKSTVVAAICCALLRRKISIAPFKPQNMALNSAVTAQGGEIGRAQALQAYACGIPPHTDMNPILLKPNSDTGAQVIIHGKAIGNQSATEYHDYKKVAKDAVLDSYQRLAKQYDAIIVEGAGSPAEINLRHNDIANMGFAEAVDCPVIIVADIDRGGVFAHLVGTLELLTQSEQDRVVGFIINRFRGDISLLQSGLDWLEERTGKKVFGVIPYLHGLHLDAEDAIPKNSIHDNTPSKNNNEQKFKVIVLALPHMSNHTDFDPLRFHPDVEFSYISPKEKSPATLPPADLIILPGSKSVQSDLQWLKKQAWDAAIKRHIRYGGKVMGICGGYQMLGYSINDPHSIESESEYSKGLGLLEIETTNQSEKILKQVTGTIASETNANETISFSGYEIHAGITTGIGLKRPALQKDCGSDGAISEDNQVIGFYPHGIFETPEACNALLQWAGLKNNTAIDFNELREIEINRLTDSLEEQINIDALWETIT